MFHSSQMCFSFIPLFYYFNTAILIDRGGVLSRETEFENRFVSSRRRGGLSVLPTYPSVYLPVFLTFA
jgi:hypothetical protein